MPGTTASVTFSLFSDNVGQLKIDGGLPSELVLFNRGDGRGASGTGYDDYSPVEKIWTLAVGFHTVE